MHADGSLSGILNVPGQIAGGQVTGDPFLRMDGPAVFKFAVRVLADIAEEVCQVAGIKTCDVDWLIPHQANIRIIEATGKRLGIDREKVIVTVAHHGNTSAASVPLALDEAVRDGRIQRGQKVLVEGVGGGFTWGAALFEF
jgi:3-oxoacyl-[acyl-carrier-protein] synthase-3